MNVEFFGTHINVSAADGQTEAWEQVVRQPAKVVLSTPLGFAGSVMIFEEVEFPASLAGMVSFVGHPATRSLVEALGAQTDASGVNGAPGKYHGPAVGESYIAVPLAQNPRTEGWTANVAVESTRDLKAILCTRIA